MAAGEDHRARRATRDRRSAPAPDLGPPDRVEGGPVFKDRDRSSPRAGVRSTRVRGRAVPARPTRACGGARSQWRSPFRYWSCLVGSGMVFRDQQTSRGARFLRLRSYGAAGGSKRAPCSMTSRRVDGAHRNLTTARDRAAVRTTLERPNPPKIWGFQGWCRPITEAG